MKKNIKLLLIIALLLLPGTVYGLSATSSISCSPEGIASGGSSKCTVYVTVNSGGLKGIDAKVSVSSGLTLSNLTAASGWNGSASGNRILLYTDSQKTGKVAIATFNIKANANTTTSQTISLTNIGYSDENDNDVTGSSVNKTINILSSNNNLSALSLSNGTLSPAFNANTLSYSSTIDAASTVITATAEDSKAKITGTGTINLKYGTNKYNVVVTAESGTKKTYVITITRPDNRSSDNTLKELKVSNTKISFNKSKTDYSEVVENDISTVNITATANDSKATVTGTGQKSLKVGRNTFVVTVTAENGSVKKYTIVIDRKNANGEVEIDKKNLSSNSYLKTLDVDKYDIKFNKNTNTYSFSVNENEDRISISYTTEDSKATATIDGDGSLKIGTNKITITVVAENGTKREYVLNVRRGNYVNNDEKEIIDAIKSDDLSTEIKVIVNDEEDIKKIPASIISALKNSDKDLIYVVSKDDIIVYSVKISKEDKNYDYSLSYESNYDKQIKKLSNKNKYLPLVLKSNNNTIISATFKININNTDLKKYTDFDLYYYEKNTNQLILVKENIKVVNGEVEVDLNNYHDFVLLPHGAKFTKVPFIIYIDILLLLIIIGLLVKVIMSKIKKEK